MLRPVINIIEFFLVRCDFLDFVVHHVLITNTYSYPTTEYEVQFPLSGKIQQSGTIRAFKTNRKYTNADQNY